MSHKDPNDDAAVSWLNTPIKLLDKAVRSEPRIKAVWGVVGVAAAATLISLLLGFNRLSFIAMIAMFLGMVLVPIVSGIRSDSRAVKFASGGTVVIVAVAIATFVVTSLSAGIICKPRPFVYFYALQDACYEPPPSRLRISNFKLFNEAHREGTGFTSALTKLESRPGNFFEIAETNRFALVIGFAVRGVEVHGNEIQLELSIAGMGPPSGASAWERKMTLYNIEEWKTNLRRFKAETILGALGLKEGEGIPVAGIISCFTAQELTRWSGVIVISAYDHFAHVGVRHNPIAFQISIDVDKLRPAESCTS